MDKVSVIIPTFNRFIFLLNTIKSVKKQTYSNIEIIVINDCSTEKEYYTFDFNKHFGENLIVINLPKNSREKFGYPCVGYVRNKGIERSTGKYIAFCDDDDIWFPNKIELQINAMKKTDCKMSSTDGLFGLGIYNENELEKYKKNKQMRYRKIKKIHRRAKSEYLENGFPKIWTYDFIKIHNCVVNSSVIVDKNILVKVGMVPYDRRGQDYKCWLNVLKHTDSVYVTDICFYYDKKHGRGKTH